MDKFKVRAVIKYFCKKGMSRKEIQDDFIKALGNVSLLFYSMAKKWAAEFGRGSECMEDYEQSGCPKVATTDKNIELVHSLNNIARQIDMFWAVQSILTDILWMSKVSARWVPRRLTKDQKKSRLNISKYLLYLYEDDPEEFMRGVVTQNET